MKYKMGEKLKHKYHDVNVTITGIDWKQDEDGNSENSYILSGAASKISGYSESELDDFYIRIGQASK